MRAADARPADMRSARKEQEEDQRRRVAYRRTTLQKSRLGAENAAPRRARSKRKRPGNRSAPQNLSEPQAATLVGLTSRRLLELAIGIARGFIASGISRTRSTCRSPFSRLAPLT